MCPQIGPELVVTPVPDRDTGDAPVLALLVTVRVPLKLPVVEGENTTENVLLCPAERVSGRVSPLIEYPVPLAFAAETVTDPPEALTVSDKVTELPVTTFPKFNEPGDALNVVATPVPLSATVGLLDALLVNETCPESPPAEGGANCTV